MEDDRRQDSTNDVDEQDISEIDSSDNEQPEPGEAGGGDVIIIK